MTKKKKGVQKTVQVGIKPMNLTWRTYIEEFKVQQVPKIPEGERGDGKCRLKTRANVSIAAQLQ